MKRGLLIFSTISLIFIIILFNNKITEVTGYTGSSINSNFPVPKDAYEKYLECKNPNIKLCVKYKYNRCDEIIGIPQEYFQTVVNWGWIKIEDDSNGDMVMFQRDNTKISITTKDNYFIISEWIN